jgi:hypothetical protein
MPAYRNGRRSLIVLGLLSILAYAGCGDSGDSDAASAASIPALVSVDEPESTGDRGSASGFQRIGTAALDSRVLGQIRQALSGRPPTVLPTVSLELFGMRTTAELRPAPWDSAGEFVVGTLPDAGDEFLLRVGDRGLSGVLHFQSGTYRITPVSRDSAFIEQIDSQSLKQCADFTRTQILSSRLNRQRGAGLRLASTAGAFAGEFPEIRILVLWTPEVRKAANLLYGVEDEASEVAIRDYVRDLSGQFEHALYRSDIRGIPSRSYAAREIAYKAVGNVYADLENLAKGRGGLSSVRNIRNSEYADVVVLLLEESGAAGGLAKSPPAANDGDSYPSAVLRDSAFAVVEWRSANDNLLFAHEIAHIFGADHDQDHGGRGLYSYSTAHRFSVGDREYISILGYRNGGETLYPGFSNPDMEVEVNGVRVRTGDEDSNNARTIRESAGAVADFMRRP